MAQRLFSMLIVAAIAGLLTSACAGGNLTGRSTAPPQPPAESSGAAPVRPGEAPAAGGAAAPGAPPPGTQPAPGTAQTVDRLIVRDASMSLVVASVDRAIEEATQVAEQGGGFVFSTNFRDTGTVASRSATMALRIPSRQYDQTMVKLRRLALKVQEEKSNAQDVTEEFSDLSAQLRNLEVTEAQYQELLKRANTIDDVLKVQQRLAETRGQIERVRGRMNFLEKRSDMASISLTFIPEPALAEIQPPGWDPWRVARQAFNASLVFLQGVATAVIVVVAFFWWLVPLGLAIYAAVRILLARRRAPRPA
jgi:hypothetical protein